MSENTSLGTPAPCSKTDRASRGRDGRKAAHYDGDAQHTKAVRPSHLSEGQSGQSEQPTNDGRRENMNWGSLAHYLEVAPPDIGWNEFLRVWRAGLDPREVWG